MRRAYRDRAAYLGDSDFIYIPVDRLLDKNYAEGLALTIDIDRATPSSELGSIATAENVGTNTTHFSVVDRDGNMVSSTLSINLPFGSGFVVEGTGIILNNEMDDFTIKPLTANNYGLIGNQANTIHPGKRPLSSMTPIFIESKDRIAILGTPGGSRIISMVLLAVLDFVKGELPDSWVSLPRFHHQYIPDLVQYGNMGLIYAVDKLKQNKLDESDDKNKTIKSFLSKRINGAIRRGIDTNRGSLRIPEHKLNEIRKDFGKDKHMVSMFFNSIFLSIDEKPKDDSNMIYQIPDNTSDYNPALLSTYLKSLLSRHLNKKEYEVLRLSYGLDCAKHSAKQIASILGIKGSSSYVRVSQLKKQAVQRLIDNVDHSQVIDYLPVE